MRLLPLVATAPLVVAALVATPAAASPGAAGTGAWITSRVTVSSMGTQADDGTVGSAISANGRYVAFMSDATNLVPGDTNGRSDIFVRDRWTRTTTRVSTGPAGVEANDGSFDPRISSDGRYIAFGSYASNLVANDGNDRTDVFVRDTHTGTTTLVSASSSGEQGNSASFEPHISATGRYVSFTSTASNLVPGQTTSDVGNAFVRDLVSGTTTQVNVASVGGAPSSGGSSYARAISASGRQVVFISWESNLVPDDTNGLPDLFVRDLVAGVTTRVNLTDDDRQASMRCDGPSISADGRYVAFYSEDPTLVGNDTNNESDVFVRDVVAATTTRVSLSTSGTQADRGSYDPVLTPDGRYVVFTSFATNLVDDDRDIWHDVFLRDLRTGRTTLVSRSTSGQIGNADSQNASITPDARHIAFDSSATNLVRGDTNTETDAFVRDRIG